MDKRNDLLRQCSVDLQKYLSGQPQDAGKGSDFFPLREETEQNYDINRGQAATNTSNPAMAPDMREE